MEITNVNVYPIKEAKGNVKAMASITFNDCFVVNGIRIVESEKGLFASMPSRRSEKDGKYYDICFPINSELREDINNAIVGTYNDVVPREKTPKKTYGRK